MPRDATFLRKGQQAGQWADDDDKGGNRNQRSRQGVRTTWKGLTMSRMQRLFNNGDGSKYYSLKLL